MKLEKIEGSENYACSVIKLPPKQSVLGLDKLVKVTVFGNDVLTGKDSDPDQLYLFFPVECRIDPQYLSINNEFRHSEQNVNRAETGFFEDTGRVKAIKFKGVISTGYVTPISTLDGYVSNWNSLEEGDEFNSINGKLLCKKYKIVYTQGQGVKESRFNKKLKRFNKLVPNQFRFHETTSQLAKNLHMFNPEDIIVITDKWHGTSAVFSNVLIKKQPSFLGRIAKFLGVEVVTTKYDNLYSSRTVIKNQYINKDATLGYYNEDIWGIVNKELEGKIEQGISIYGEIVGYLSSGKAIQKGYDYGCLDEHKLVIYRITYTKPDGNLIEFSWQQIKDYCKKYGLETVKELWFGRAVEQHYDIPAVSVEHWRGTFLDMLQTHWLEKDCSYCVNKVPQEGICIRIDGRDTYMTYKIKSKRFLKKESDDLDEAAKTGEVNIEDEGELNQTSEIQQN